MRKPALALWLLASMLRAESSVDGKLLFERRCTGCHALDTVKVGPPLRSIFLSASGKDPKFRYSEGLKKAGLTWDAATLDRWLTDPDSVAPDNDMPFRLNDAKQREAIIAYLRQVSGK
jgi:cytochrome c